MPHVVSHRSYIVREATRIEAQIGGRCVLTGKVCLLSSQVNFATQEETSPFFASGRGAKIRRNSSGRRSSMPPASARPLLSSLPKGVTLGYTRGRTDERLSSGNDSLDRLLGGGF